ncbi:MAG TPA: hypothetical protein PLN48_11225 [Lachnospiraceae bacterium]|nr:hypothetical protein [Lachnospiraceae bacterium]
MRNGISDTRGNRQLICLSDIDKADITSCFYDFIKAAVKPLKHSTMEFLIHDGNEAIEHGCYHSIACNCLQCVHFLMYTMVKGV